jgi:ADP-heptose:LPS heptosyltransferase
MRSNRFLKATDHVAGTAAFALLQAHRRFREAVSGTARAPQALEEFAPHAILAIKLCCLGDGILAVPALRALKRRWPEARLMMLCTPRDVETFTHLAFIDELLVLPVTGLAGPRELLGGLRTATGLLRRIRRARPELAVDLDLYYRATPILAYLSGAPVRVGFDTPGTQRAGLFTTAVYRDPNRWELECFLDVVQAAGAASEDRTLEFPVTPEAGREATQLLEQAGMSNTPYITLCPGSSKNWPQKQWASDRFAAVADWARREHGMGAVVVGAGFEWELGEAVVAAASCPIVNLAGKTTIQQTAALLQRSAALVTNDTGPMHLACAVHTPVVAIFGPTNDGKWGPRGERCVIVTDPSCTCRPCYTDSYMPDCQDRRCLANITVEQVTAALDGLLRATASAPSSR